MAGLAAGVGLGPCPYFLTERSAEVRVENLGEFARRKNNKLGMQPVGEDLGSSSAAAAEQSEGNSGAREPIWAGSLGLFEGRALNHDSGAVCASSSSSGARWDSAVAFCGGPVWALDWLGSASLYGAQEEGHQIMAVAGMPEGFRQTTAGVQLKGSNAVQIWSMGRMGPKDLSMKGEPKLLMLIEVSSPVIHAVGWCKWKGFVSTSASLGLLCVAVGDGSISVFSVPFPDQAWSAERKVLTIEPVASVVVDSGRGLLRGHATCIAWGPPPDSEGTPGWVAAGCTTGETLLIPVGPGASKEIVCLNSDEGSGVLSLDVCGRGGGFEWETGAIVVTGCMDGKLRVWDITRPHNPLHTSIARGKGWVTSVAWVGGSINCIIASTANGLVTRFSMKAVNLKAMVERPGDFWGIHVNFSMSHLAFASAEGIVMVKPLGRLGTHEIIYNKSKTPGTLFGDTVATHVVALEPPPPGGGKRSTVVIGAARRTRDTVLFDDKVGLTNRATTGMKRKGDADDGNDDDQKLSKSAKKAEKEDKDAPKNVTWSLPSTGVGVHRVKWHPEKEGLLMWAGHSGIIFCAFVL